MDENYPVGSDGSEVVRADADRPDVRELMARIRAQVKVELAREDRPRRPFPTYAAEEGKGSTHRAGDLLHSEDLRGLNERYIFTPSLDLDKVTTHRKGPLARAMVSLKRKVLGIVWDYLLKDYFQAEREFHIRLVRHLNHTSKYIDGRDASNFWELIRKLDYDVTKAMRRIEEIQDEQGGSLRTSERTLHQALGEQCLRLEQQIHRLADASGRHEADLVSLQSVSSGLESIVSRLTTPLPVAEVSEGGPVPAAEISSNSSVNYLLLENRFRGSEASISERLGIYTQVFEPVRAQSANQPVLEIGGGRGELQKLFREASISSYCVDIDPAMVEHAIASGVDAHLGDAVQHLVSLPDRSRSGIIAVQVVEHLTQGYLERLTREAYRVLVPDGILVFETINPRSLVALSSNYFRDPTHVFPQHPDTLAYQVGLGGFEVQEIRLLSPIPDEAKLSMIEVEPFMTPRWAHTVESLNQSLGRLNDLLFGHQDYCIIARRRP